jgi:hypothetical protein
MKLSEIAVKETTTPNQAILNPLGMLLSIIHQNLALSNTQMNIAQTVVMMPNQSMAVTAVKVCIDITHLLALLPFSSTPVVIQRLPK